jgi:hypothetical protein
MKYNNTSTQQTLHRSLKTSKSEVRHLQRSTAATLGICHHTVRCTGTTVNILNGYTVTTPIRNNNNKYIQEKTTLPLAEFATHWYTLVHLFAELNRNLA